MDTEMVMVTGSGKMVKQQDGNGDSDSDGDSWRQNVDDGYRDGW